MKKIVILSGGTGNEIEIAKKSAKFIKDYIKEDFDYYELPKDLGLLIKNKDKYSLAIPVFHGEYGEDGKIFAFLNVLGIPHTFSDYSAHSLCINKFKTNILVKDLRIKIPKQILLKRPHSLDNSKLELIEKLSFPVIVKPNKGGSSFYTYKITNTKELIEALNVMKLELNDDILIQEFISGEEYSVPVVNGEILPIMKLEKSEDDFFDYTSKYEDNSRIKEIFPKIDDDLKNKLSLDTKKIYNFFNLKGISRVDFLVKNNNVYFLEVNTIPGLTEVSILPQAWKLTGKSYKELISEIINIK